MTMPSRDPQRLPARTIGMPESWRNRSGRWQPMQMPRQDHQSENSLADCAFFPIAAGLPFQTLALFRLIVVGQRRKCWNHLILRRAHVAFLRVRAPHRRTSSPAWQLDRAFLFHLVNFTWTASGHVDL